MYLVCLESPDLAVILDNIFHKTGFCLSLAMSIFVASKAILYSLLRYIATILMKTSSVW